MLIIGELTGTKSFLQVYFQYLILLFNMSHLPTGPSIRLEKSFFWHNFQEKKKKKKKKKKKNLFFVGGTPEEICTRVWVKWDNNKKGRISWQKERKRKKKRFKALNDLNLTRKQQPTYLNQGWIDKRTRDDHRQFDYIHLRQTKKKKKKKKKKEVVKSFSIILVAFFLHSIFQNVFSGAERVLSKDIFIAPPMF